METILLFLLSLAGPFRLFIKNGSFIEEIDPTIQTLGHIFETLATINEIGKCYNYGAKAFSEIAFAVCINDIN